MHYVVLINPVMFVQQKLCRNICTCCKRKYICFSNSFHTFFWLIVLFNSRQHKICKNYTNLAKADVTTRINNFAIHLWPLSLRGVPPPLRYNWCSLRSRLRGVSSPTPIFAHRRCGYMKGKSKRKVAHIPGHQTAIDLSAEPRKWFGHWHHLDLT